MKIMRTIILRNLINGDVINFKSSKKPIVKKNIEKIDPFLMLLIRIHMLLD